MSKGISHVFYYKSDLWDISETEFLSYFQVVGQDSNEIHFRVKQTTQMGKLKKSYSERVGVPVSSLRFLFDGRRINDDETPKALEMEQGWKFMSCCQSQELCQQASWLLIGCTQE